MTSWGNERGNVALFVVIVIAVVILGFVACDALFVDDDEKDDLGMLPAAWIMDNDYEGGDEEGRNNGGEDCRDARGPCEDNDASPSFTDSPVEDSFIFEPTICMPLSRCDFDGGEEEPAA